MIQQSQKFSESYSVTMFLRVEIFASKGCNIIRKSFSVCEIASNKIWCISIVVMIFNYVYICAGRLLLGNEDILKNITRG